MRTVRLEVRHLAALILRVHPEQQKQRVMQTAKQSRGVQIEKRSASQPRAARKAAQGSGLEAVSDLGGAVITGVDGNPLAVLAMQLGIDMHRIEAESHECPLFFRDGATVNPTLDEQVGHHRPL